MAQSKRSTTSFTAEERAAMQERAQELKSGGGGVGAVLDKIGAMPVPDRTLGERLHATIMATAPELTPRLWYGMPAYAKGDKTICFYQNAHKFKTRYSTLGFSDKAKLDDGSLWPTAYAVLEWTPAVAAEIAALVKQAVR